MLPDKLCGGVLTNLDESGEKTKDRCSFQQEKNSIATSLVMACALSSVTSGDADLSLVRKSFKSENYFIREKLLEESPLWVTSNLHEKYTKWFHQKHGNLPKYEDSDSDSEFCIDDEYEEPQTSDWVLADTKPPGYVSSAEDGNTSDDGLDVERCHASTGGYTMANMFRQLSKTKVEDQVISNFFEALKYISSELKHNKNKLFTLRIKLLGVTEYIYRTIEVHVFRHEGCSRWQLA